MTTTQNQTIIRDFISAAAKPVGPYPVLVLCGPSASGKSALLRAICDEIEPGTAFRYLPRERHDTILLAECCAVVGIDARRRIPAATFEHLRALAGARPVVVTSPHPVQPVDGVWVVTLGGMSQSQMLPGVADLDTLLARATARA